MGILGAIVQPPASLLLFRHPDLFQGSAIRAQQVRNKNVGPTMLAHCFLEKFQCRLLVACLGDKALQDFALVINGPPKIVPLPIDCDEDFIELPCIARALLAMPDRVRKGLPELEAPLANGFISHHNAARRKQFFDVAVAQCEPKLHPHGVTYNFVWVTVACIGIGRCIHPLILARPAFPCSS